MAKHITEAHLEQARILQERLAAQGINDDIINQWIDQPGKLDAILADNQLLQQFFQTRWRGLNSITNWEFDDPFQSQSAQIQAPGKYAAYYDEATRGPTGNVIGRDYMPENLIFGDPQKLVDEGFMTPEQVHYFQQILEHGLFSQGNPAASTQGGAPGVPGAGAGKAYSAGGAGPAPQGGARGGAPKTLGYGGQPKTLGGGAPPPPPPGAGGAYPPPPPMPGGTGGGMAGMQPGQYVAQSTIDYISQVDGPAGMMLGGLLGDVNLSNGVIYGLMDSIESDRQTLARLRDLMAGKDPTDPQARHEIATISQEISAINDTMSSKMDKLQTARRFVTERESMVKGVIDKMFQATDAVIRNMRVGG